MSKPFWLKVPLKRDELIEELRQELIHLQHAIWIGEVEAVRESVLQIVREMEWTIEKLEQNPQAKR